MFFSFKKRMNDMHPQKLMKTPKQASFHLFLCLILLSYLHTALFQSSSFSPNPHGKIFKCFCQKPIQVLMSFDGILWLSYALNGNGSFYDYFSTKTLDLGILRLMKTPMDLRVFMRILHYYMIYKMGIC